MTGTAPAIPAGADAVVVEDDEDVGRLLCFILESEGFKVSLFADGQAAAERIRTGAPPTVVLLDVMLPHLNGFEILAIVRGLPAWQKVPVLMLTAKSREADVVRALEGGANDYVSKPFKPAELKARIRRLVAAE
jgi:DNA-binding response OmpR family regulator